MRIGIDVTPLLGQPTGVGVFTSELLGALAQRGDVDLAGYAVTWRGRGGLTGRLPAGVAVGRWPMAARPLRALWSRADLPPIEWWTGRLDVVHGTNFVVPPARHAARVVTVHDLTPVRFPELANADTLAYPALIRRAVRRGAFVHTPSHFVAAEVRDWLAGEVDPEHVIAIHNGVSLPRRSPSGSVEGSRAEGDPAAGHRLAGTNAPYIATLATIEPRKDHATLLAAFDLLADHVDDVELVIAGPDGWGVDAFNAALAATRHRPRVRRLGWLDAQQRWDLLAGASVLAYPSLYEGFGLPPLEAMAAGVPVVCSDAGPLPEVTGDAALRFGARDPQALASGLSRVLADAELRARLITAGYRRVADFGWDRCAAGLFDLYRRAANLS